MKLRYPEDGYTRPAIIFFRAIGRLALRPRSQPAIPTTCQHPPFFFHLSSPFHPRKESQCQCCALFPPPRFPFPSLADRRHFFQFIFFLPLAPFLKDYDERKMKDAATRILAEGTRFSNSRSRIVGISCARIPSEIAFFREQTVRARNTQRVD